MEAYIVKDLKSNGALNVFVKLDSFIEDEDQIQLINFREYDTHGDKNQYEVFPKDGIVKISKDSFSQYQELLYKNNIEEIKSLIESEIYNHFTFNFLKGEAM